MKTLTFIMFALFLSACKIDSKSSSNNKPASLNQNQIAISSAAINTSEVDRFFNELKERQATHPNQMYEAIKSDSMRSGSIIVSAQKDDHLYANKNFYIFIGLGETETDVGIQKTDWNAIYKIMNYVAEKNYRVIINVQATAEHLRFAAEDDQTSVILWSSHGNEKAFYDYAKKPVPFDIFKNKSKNFYQFILASCKGRLALDDNYFHDGMTTFAWSELTTSSDMESFLVSDEWSSEDGKKLVTPNAKGFSCTASGVSFSMINDARVKIPDMNFGTLEECKEALK